MMGVFTWWTKKNTSLKVHATSSFFVESDFGIEGYVLVLDHLDILEGAVPHQAAECYGIWEQMAYCLVVESANKWL